MVSRLLRAASSSRCVTSRWRAMTRASRSAESTSGSSARLREWRCPRNLPRKAAFEMLVTGEFVSAEEAHVLGLVNRVAAPEALDDEVEALVARIVAKPGVAVAMGKALFYRQIEVGIESAYEDAGATMACNMMDPSALEGVQAFIEKRPPSWLAAQASTT